MLSGRVRFGDFEADIASGQLRRGGELIPIQDLPFRLLTALLERPGEVVSRGELTTTLWGSDTFVDAVAGLNTAVAKLREALGDNAEQPIYVETVPKRGYRFIGHIVPAAEQERSATALAERAVEREGCGRANADSPLALARRGADRSRARRACGVSASSRSRTSPSRGDVVRQRNRATGDGPPRSGTH